MGQPLTRVSAVAAMGLTLALMAMALAAGCSGGTPATDKARSFAAKIQILKIVPVQEDSMEQGRRRYHRLKLTIKNNNLEPLNLLMGHAVLEEENGEIVDLPGKVLFAADPRRGKPEIHGLEQKDEIVEGSFHMYDTSDDRTYLPAFKVKSITPTEAFSDHEQFQSFIFEKAAAVEAARAAN